MFPRNKTGEWTDKLAEENLKKAMNFAKNSKKQQKLVYLAKQSTFKKIKKQNFGKVWMKKREKRNFRQKREASEAVK